MAACYGVNHTESFCILVHKKSKLWRPCAGAIHTPVTSKLVISRDHGRTGLKSDYNGWLKDEDNTKLPSGTSIHSFAVQNHVIERNWQGGVMSVNYHCH